MANPNGCVRHALYSLVVEAGPHGLQGGPGTEVFRGDELEAGALPLLLVLDQSEHFRIVLLQRLIACPE